MFLKFGSKESCSYLVSLIVKRGFLRWEYLSYLLVTTLRLINLIFHFNEFGWDRRPLLTDSLLSLYINSFTILLLGKILGKPC